MRVFILVTLLFGCLNSFAQTGITWNMGMNIAASTYGNMHPRIVTDAQGDPLVIWGRMADASLFFSRWTGTAFSQPVQVNPMWLEIATASWMGPDIAARGDTVYLVMKRKPEASDTNHIFLVSSFDEGQTFSAPVQVDNIGDSLSRFPSVAVDAKGNPQVGFMKFNPNFSNARWVVTRSSDYGNTFSADVKASGWSSPTSTVCDCCPGRLLNNGAVTIMLYRDNNNNIRDTWAGLSLDSGYAFNSGFAADNLNWMLANCPASGPDGVIINDTLYSVFMSGASGMARTCFSAVSVSNPQAPSVQYLTGALPGLTTQIFPRMASYDQAVAIVWKQAVSGSDELPILFSGNIANGLPALADTVDMDHITNADVAMHDGTIYVVWQDDNSGTVKFRSGTYSTGSGLEDISARKSLEVYPDPVGDFLTVRPGIPEGEWNVRMFTMTGQEILFAKPVHSGQAMKLDVSSLNRGMYMLLLYDKNTLLRSRFVKQ